MKYTRGYPEIYHDESGERFQQLFLQAEAKREAFRHSLRMTAFWFGVFSLGIGLVFAKLWTMGAIVGLR